MSVVYLSVFHALSLAAYSYAFYLELFHFAIHYYSFAFKFATTWFNLYCVIYHGCALVQEFLIHNQTKVSIHTTLTRLFTTIVDYMYASIIFPQAPLVSLVFWSIYLLDPTGAVPPHVQRDPYWFWATHLQHTLILPTMIFDLFCKNHKYPDKSFGIRLGLTFTLCFGLLLAFRGIVYNDWTYSAFQKLNALSICVVYFMSNSALVMFYLIGDAVNSVLNRNILEIYKINSE